MTSQICSSDPILVTRVDNTTTPVTSQFPKTPALERMVLGTTMASVNEYTLLESTIICDEQLYQPLMKVYVIDAVGNPIAGVQLRIDWTTGSDIFATGLHPDIGYGYADFVIDPQQVYTLQVGSSTNPIYGISSEPCRIGNSTEFDGSVLIKWQQEG